MMQGLTTFEQVAIWSVLGVAILGLAYAWFLRTQILREDKGTEKMQEVWGAIRDGADAYLKRQLNSILPLIAILTVALFFSVYIVPPELRLEGIAREFVNRIQNLRKESNFDVTDKIILRIVRHPELNEAMDKFADYIGNQTLASRVELVANLPADKGKLVEIEKEIETYIQVEKEIV